jgi:signal transduction histidine kinase
MMPPGAIEAAILAVSLVNAILLLWLGLTVLLNAEVRTAGVCLTGGAMLAGGTFFMAQAWVAGHGLPQITVAMQLQWPLGWFIGLVLPLAWYVTVLWHGGFWASRQAPLRRRHFPWVVVTLFFGTGVLGLAVKASQYPWSWPRGPLEPFARPVVAGVPLLALVYPLFIALCIALSLDVLRRPDPSPRLMVDLARERARPWLIAASGVLLLVTFLVGAIMMGVALDAPLPLVSTSPGVLPPLVVWGDLLVSVLIVVAVLFLGQAIVAYEIFTGKTLPRRGLRRQWYSAIVLAVGYAAVTGWSVAMLSKPFHGLLLATVLITVFYALFNWRSYAERDRYIEHLRPFVTSPRVYDALLEPEAPEVDAGAPFRAFCAEVLGARAAYLVAVGPLSSLADPPLAHPQGAAAPTDVSGIVSQCDSPGTMCLAVDPASYAAAMWAVPLWSERGLIGLLLLGEKTDGGLYTQEEMEIARASGERLIDTLACARMAQRLMALQRQRLAESQVVDRRARRVLHDDVLPALHAAMLALGDSREASPSETVKQLSGVHRQLSELLREMPTPTGSEVARLGLIGMLRHVLVDEFAEVFDQVAWQIDPAAEQKAEDLPSLTAEVLFYAAREAIRNAARHGRGDDPARPLCLKLAVAWRDGLQLAVEDDGVGLDSAHEATGARQGIALHSTMMAVLGGGWVTESRPGEFTRVTLSLPPDSG